MMNSEDTNVVVKKGVGGPASEVSHSSITSDIFRRRDTGYSKDPPGLPISPVTRESTHNSQMSAQSAKLICDDGAVNSLLTTGAAQLHSVQLIGDKENILLTDHDAMAEHLDCPVGRPVKVISIVGNTGDGKSYTLNHTFCGGQQVFPTSPSQKTCTMGVWVAYLPEPSCILLDTEGFLGTGLNHNQHRRLLLKVFALSDVVIYLTKAARLHSDMFTVLADASDAFATHFRPDLEALAKRTKLPWTPGQLGPAVIVFQETRHTNPIEETDLLESISGVSISCSQDGQTVTSGSRFIRKRLVEMKRNADSFSSLHYLGLQTKGDTTDFQPLASLVSQLVTDNAVRAPRKLQHIFACLQSLNARFATDLPTTAESGTFVEEYFTCHVTCVSCSARCCLGVGHMADDIPHCAPTPGKATKSAGIRRTVETGCRYDRSLQNKLYFCKDCYAVGHRTMMLPRVGETVVDAARYLYSGYVLECPKHGIVYRSRQHWSGNLEPEETPRVHWEVVHVWNGEKSILLGLHPFSQVLVDGLATVTNQVSQLTGPPARILGDLLADSIAPDYWQPNSLITACAICKFVFPCTAVDGSDYTTYTTTATVSGTPNPQCSGDEMPKPSSLTSVDNSNKVPSENVRFPTTHSMEHDPTDKDATRLTSHSGFAYSEKLSTRSQTVSLPDDHKLWQDVTKHHCRICGLGVCAVCSTARMPVPGYGTDPVRVCDKCYRNEMDNRKFSQIGNTAAIAVHTQQRDRKKTLSESSSVHKPELQSDSSSDTAIYTGRKAFEMCLATVSAVPPLLSRVKNTIKGLARPDYWTPDELCKQCLICELPFGPSRHIHHCRACGQGVCEPCSPHRLPVPLRGLEQLHRVCNNCVHSDSVNTRR